MNFSKDELIKMVYVLGEAQGNALLASRLYGLNYPEARHPQVSVFKKVKDRFDRTGSVHYQKKVLPNRQIKADDEINVILKVQENPQISTRQIANEAEVSRSSINRVLRKHRFHPYHIELHQELRDTDPVDRVDFCHIMFGKLNQDPNFVAKVLFTDEATFKSNGTVNRHNMHYYATDNPNWMREVNHQNHWSINVWGGILGDHVIGPFFFDQTLTGMIYLDFLENELDELTEDVDLATIRAMWFQQDGAPVHFHGEVRRFLNDHFTDRWIGRGGPIAWPPRSPDLTPLDFFFWGYIKSLVFEQPPTTRDEMKQRITTAFRSVTPEILQNVRRSFTERLNACVRENGGIIEHLL